MHKTTTITELKASISLLELEHAQKMQVLKNKFHETIHDLRKGNLLKNAISDFVSSSILKKSVMGPSLGVAAGYISKIIVVGKSSNKLKLLMGSVVQYGVTSLVVSNFESISKLSQQIYQAIFRKRH